MIIFDNCPNVFIWSIYVFPNLVKIFIEALRIILRLPMILV